MSAAIHPFPGRDPHQVPHLATDDLLAELAAAVSSPAPARRATGDTTARPGGSVAPLRRDRAAGTNDLVVVGAASSRRRLAMIVAVALALAATFVLLAGLGGASADGEAPVVATTMFEDGDTLWGIAEEVTPTGGDVRATVAAIMDLNGFDSSSLPVGTVVRLPDLGH